MPSIKNLSLSFLDLVLAMVYLHLGFIVSALTFAWTLSSLFGNGEGDLPWSLAVWIALAPLLYVAWLIWFLAQCCLEYHFHCLWMRYRKPARVNPTEGFHSYLLFYGSIFLYLRMRYIYSLPIVESLVTIPGIRHLVFRSYAGSDHLGFHSLVLGYLYDPDLTELGDGAILGSGASAICHSLTMNPDGTRLLVTIPIKIGPRSVVGGGATLHPGVVIGADAVVEPSSYVPALTQIGDNEVWGGNPARFLRMRNGEATATLPPEFTPADLNVDLLEAAHEELLRTIVAEALHRPVQSITAAMSANDSAAWDSLAQLGMALSLQRRFGIRLTSHESFGLRSMADLRAAIRQS